MSPGNFHISTAILTSGLRSFYSSPQGIAILPSLFCVFYSISQATWPHSSGSFLKFDSLITWAKRENINSSTIYLFIFTEALLEEVKGHPSTTSCNPQTMENCILPWTPTDNGTELISGFYVCYINPYKEFPWKPQSATLVEWVSFSGSEIRKLRCFP